MRHSSASRDSTDLCTRITALQHKIVTQPATSQYTVPVQYYPLPWRASGVTVRCAEAVRKVASGCARLATVCCSEGVRRCRHAQVSVHAETMRHGPEVALELDVGLQVHASVAAVLEALAGGHGAVDLRQSGQGRGVKTCYLLKHRHGTYIKHHSAVQGPTPGPGNALNGAPPAPPRSPDSTWPLCRSAVTPRAR